MRPEEASEVLDLLAAGRRVRIDGMVYVCRERDGAGVLMCDVLGRELPSDLSVTGLLRSSRWEVVA